MKRFFALLYFALFALPNAEPMVSAEPSSEILTNASDVLSLSAEQASRGIKISVKGVVTVAEPTWGGRFFVQDSSGGVFVENISDIQPSPGDVISVSGVSYPGGYAPIISKPHWEKLGTAPLPPAKVVSMDQFMSGSADSQRVEISGIVRSATTNGDRLALELASDGYRVRAFSPIPPGIDPQTLLGSKVRMRGTAAVSFNAPLRHFITVVLFASEVADFIVENPAEANPFMEPLTPLNGIAQYRKARTLGNRVHVKGTVIYQRKGEDVFLRDASGGLQVKSSEDMSFSPGDVIEAVGFPGVENFLPVLEDSIFKKTSEPRVEIAPKVATEGALLEGLHHADFITLKGKLLDRVQSPGDKPDTSKIILVLQATNLLFTAEKEATEESAFLTSIPIGSVIEVSGICLLQSEEDGKIKSLQVLLPTAQDVRIISRPSWLTAQHLLIILTVVFVSLVIAISWTIMVSKKNSTLRYLIHERELDQKELQKAHDTLEWRVKERTEQLKFQITARKEAEVQFKAVLTERTRLAKELHDTLEQTLTGITLQLNTVAKLFKQNPEAASYHLGLSRNMMRMSRVDLRRSIWDLRSRELEEFDLSTALSISGNQIADSAGIRAEVETKGNVRPLPEVIEENLLRISQEAITNTVKHSGANCVKIELEFNVKNVILEISDNGNGFTPENCVGPNDGHFGLLGMSERVKRLGGHISITSAPGKGTAIRVELPTEQIQVHKSVYEPIEHEESIKHTDSGC